MRTKRKKFFCFYCHWIWLSSVTPKVCPRCHNPVGQRPKHHKYKRKKGGTSR